MTGYLPQDVLDGLHAGTARKRPTRRLSVRTGGKTVPIVDLFEEGFTVSDTASRLRGLVEIFDGGKRKFQALIVASSDTDGKLRYDFKRRSRAWDEAPVDFAKRAQIDGYLDTPS